MNGVVNFSVLDGWWLEGYREGAGWALTEKRTYQNQEYQDQLDAATIYSILEQEILPVVLCTQQEGIFRRLDQNYQELHRTDCASLHNEASVGRLL